MIKVQNQLIPNFTADTYLMDEGLKRAVEVAIALDQPLLLTGEPGTGKTKLAYKVAHDLAKEKHDKYDFLDEPLVFNTKTTSSSRDLFYMYDALGHFQAANIKTEKNLTTAQFIELKALGKAIALTNPAAVDTTKFKTTLGKTPKSCVVLIDEIDKAPRDFTNDILNEIENYEFEIKEQENHLIKKGDDQRIIVIMTSNSEKNLPDAFLRRCIFYHIPFPNPKRLKQIAMMQLGINSNFQKADTLLEELIDKFNIIRKKAIRKPPATAELIAWLRILEMNDIFNQDAQNQTKQLRDNLSILIKTKEDLEAVRGMFS